MRAIEKSGDHNRVRDAIVTIFLANDIAADNTRLKYSTYTHRHIAELLVVCIGSNIDNIIIISILSNFAWSDTVFHCCRFVFQVLVPG